MSEAKLIDTSIRTSYKLDTDELGPKVNKIMYRGIIGARLYITSSRPRIVFSVVMCVRSQYFPKESYLKAAKRILRYLKGTRDLVLY